MSARPELQRTMSSDNLHKKGGRKGERNCGQLPQSRGKKGERKRNSRCGGRLAARRCRRRSAPPRVLPECAHSSSERGREEHKRKKHGARNKEGGGKGGKACELVGNPIYSQTYSGQIKNGHLEFCRRYIYRPAAPGLATCCRLDRATNSLRRRRR
jgi:hypothetical protein